MPELPEVETIRRDLQKVLIGRTIARIEAGDRRLLSAASETKFDRPLSGKSLREINRKGKYLPILISGGWELIFHR